MTILIVPNLGGERVRRCSCHRTAVLHAYSPLHAVVETFRLAFGWLVRNEHWLPATRTGVGPIGICANASAALGAVPADAIKAECVTARKDGLFVVHCVEANWAGICISVGVLYPVIRGTAEHLAAKICARAADVLVVARVLTGRRPILAPSTRTIATGSRPNHGDFF